MQRGVAQLVEYRSPKPWVAGSSPPAPAKKKKSTFFVGFFFLLGYNLRRTRRGAVVNDSPVDCQSRGRPTSRSKAEIKNSALRRSDETESSRPCQTKIRFRQEGGFFVCIIHFSLFNIHYSFVFSGFSMKNE